MCPMSSNMVMGTKYQTGIERDIFYDVRVSMAWCEKNQGGGHKKGVYVMVGGKVMTLSTVRGMVSGTRYGLGVVFDEVIMHTSAPVFGTSSCFTEASRGNVLRRADGLN